LAASVRSAGQRRYVAEIGTREERHARARRGGRQNTELANQFAHHEQDIVMFDVPPPLQSRGMGEYKETWDLFFKYRARASLRAVDGLGSKNPATLVTHRTFDTCVRICT